jgi:hypothetical protein
MKAKYWLEHFQGNATGRAEPEWHLPSPLTGATRRELARSLSHFQLGESGEGGFLLRQAREQFPDDHTYAQALELFVAEEKEHARAFRRVCVEQEWALGEARHDRSR